MNDREVLKRVEKIINDIFFQEYLEEEDRVAIETMYKQYKNTLNVENVDNFVDKMKGGVKYG